MTSIKDYEPTPEEQEFFENKVYTAYFISTVKRTGLGGPVEFLPVGTVPKAEFLKRSEDREQRYEDLTVSAMWFGFKIGLMSSKEK